MTTKEAALKSRLTHLAAGYPKGSLERRQLLWAIVGEGPQPVAPGPNDFNPFEIGQVVPGALEGAQFTQQEFSELGDKQEKGELGMKVDDAEKAMPPGQQEDRLANERPLFDSLIKLAKDDAEVRPTILSTLKAAGVITPEGKVHLAGCEKLPEGGMRDNCEKKKEEGKANDKKEDKKEDKKAALPEQVTSVRDLVVRLAKDNLDHRAKFLGVVMAFDKSCGIDHGAILKARKVEAAAIEAATAIEAAKAVTKKAFELGYDKAAAVAAGKKAHGSYQAA